MRNIDRGNRIYNGLPSNLMNDIYDGLIDRYGDIKYFPKGWDTLSLYLARTCGVLERKGWKNEKLR